MPTRTTTTTPSELFKNVDPDIDRRKNIISMEQYEDKQFDLKKIEQDTAIQVNNFYIFNH